MIVLGVFRFARDCGCSRARPGRSQVIAETPLPGPLLPAVLRTIAMAMEALECLALAVALWVDGAILPAPDGEGHTVL